MADQQADRGWRVEGGGGMSGHYEDEWELAELQKLKEQSGHDGPMRQIPNRLRVVAPDVKPNRPGRYRPGKPKP